MIAITGASGNLGKATVKLLLTKIAPHDIVAIVRDPAKMNDLPGSGIQIRTADYEHPGSLIRALKGVKRLLQVSTSSIGAKGIEHEENVVRAAKTAGVQHIVYTSTVTPRAKAHFLPTKQSIHTENMILRSGLSYTFSRNSLYMESLPGLLGQALYDGKIEYPAGSGTVSFVSRRDIAETLSNVLTENGHENKTYEITGMKANSFADLANLLVIEKGLNASYTNTPVKSFQDQLSMLKLPAETVDMLVSLAMGIQSGEFEHVDPALKNLLKRQPLTIEEYIRTL